MHCDAPSRPVCNGSSSGPGSPPRAGGRAPVVPGEIVALAWQAHGARVGDLVLTDSLNGVTTPIGSPFRLTLADGKTIGIEQLDLTSPPTRSALPGDPKASRMSETLSRETVTFVLTDPEHRFRVVWRLIQPHHAPYLREEVTVTALSRDEAVTRVDLFQANGLDAEVVGNTAGSPVVAGRDYWLLEDPLSQSSVNLRHGRFQMWVDRTLPLIKDQPVTYSAVVGATAPGAIATRFWPMWRPSARIPTAPSCTIIPGTTSATSPPTARPRRWTGSVPLAKPSPSSEG